MRPLHCCWFLALMLLLISGCATSGTAELPLEVIPEYEPETIGDEVLAALGSTIGAEILQTEWYLHCPRAPILILGDIEGQEKPGLNNQAYLNALQQTLLKSGRIILVEPRGGTARPVLPQNQSQADSLLTTSAAGCFGQSLIDGPKGQRRLLLRIYALPQLKLLASASTEYDL